MGGKRVPRLRGPNGPYPHILKSFSYRRKISNMSSIRSEQVVVSVPHYIEQTVFDVSNWKLPLRVRFPHVPIFNCRRRTNCENFDVENKKVKFALLEASEINFASIVANQFEIVFNSVKSEKISKLSSKTCFISSSH